jgi:hypothetical protein
LALFPRKENKSTTHINYSIVGHYQILVDLRSFCDSQGQKVKNHLFKAAKVSQNKLAVNDDWYKLLPGEVDQEYSQESSKMTSLDKIVAKVIQGFRYEKNSEFVSTKDTLISLPREKRVRINIEILQISNSQLIVQNPHSEENLTIPKNATFPAIRTASWQKSIKIKHPMDFAIIGRFDGDNQFWTEPGVDQMLVRR